MRAIGHEIKSPLQSLKTRTENNAEISFEIDKMARAVDALHMATSVEAGLRGRNVIPKVGDLAAFLRRHCENVRKEGVKIVHEGHEGVLNAYYDPIALDDVLVSILDNAKHDMYEDSELRLGLTAYEDLVEVNFLNEGAPIPEADISQVFDYQFTTRKESSEHMGLGLFSARLNVLAMKGIIRVENSVRGVNFVITLAKNAQIAQ